MTPFKKVIEYQPGDLVTIMWPENHACCDTLLLLRKVDNFSIDYETWSMLATDGHQPPERLKSRLPTSPRTISKTCVFKIFRRGEVIFLNEMGVLLVGGVVKHDR